MRRRALLAGLALLLAGPAAALDLVLDPAGLDPARQARAQALVAETLAVLPDPWQQLSFQLPLRFDRSLPADVVGHHRAGRLWLAPSLLDDDAPPGKARAALVHEIAHALDRGGAHWSADPRFRVLVGWDRHGDNRWSLRSIDAQALQSPAESLAVHLEGHLLDPAYRCRQPALAAWFDARVGTAPLARSTCAGALPLVVASGAGAAMTLETVDPARVWAVDYLLAGNGAAPMSRFGHSMLRLVICAPGREPGPRCRMDLAHHRVLSFRAFVDDVQVSSWQGLTGGYPSRLFVLPLDQVIDEYTRVELRQLTAHPLALDRSQREALLQAAAQAHWRYDGDYRFVGNNCAVESGRLLDTALATANPLQRRTPRGVLRALRAGGWLDPAAQPDDADQARRQGLLFASAEAEYRLLLQRLQQAGQVDARWRLHDWLDAAPAQRGALPAALALEQAAAWLVLERAALRRAELRALASLKPRLRQDPALAAAVAGWRQWLAGMDGPGALPVPGYGLPDQAEREAVAALLERHSQAAQSGWQALQQAGEGALPAAQRAMLEATRQRVRALGDQVRRLSADG